MKTRVLLLLGLVGCLWSLISIACGDQYDDVELVEATTDGVEGYALNGGTNYLDGDYYDGYKAMAVGVVYVHYATNQWTKQCGAAMVRRGWVLVAEHCLKDGNDDPYGNNEIAVAFRYQDKHNNNKYLDTYTDSDFLTYAGTLGTDLFYLDTSTETCLDGSCAAGANPYPIRSLNTDQSRDLALVKLKGNLPYSNYYQYLYQVPEARPGSTYFASGTMKITGYGYPVCQYPYSLNYYPRQYKNVTISGSSAKPTGNTVYGMYSWTGTQFGLFDSGAPGFYGDEVAAINEDCGSPQYAVNLSASYSSSSQSVRTWIDQTTGLANWTGYAFGGSAPYCYTQTGSSSWASCSESIDGTTKTYKTLAVPSGGKEIWRIDLRVERKVGYILQSYSNLPGRRSVHIEASEDGSSWTRIVTSAQVGGSCESTMCGLTHNETKLADTYYRYWRTLDGGGGITGGRLNEVRLYTWTPAYNGAPCENWWTPGADCMSGYCNDAPWVCDDPPPEY